MVSIESFVPEKKKPVILFVTENCPDLNYYFYRTLSEVPFNGANNLLRNLTTVLGIYDRERKVPEQDILKMFLQRYFLIDAYQNSQLWTPRTPRHRTATLYKEIIKTNPDQIIFTCKRSNISTVNALLEYERVALPADPEIIKRRIVSNPEGGLVFNSPSNRAFAGFQRQFQMAVENGSLIL